MANPDVLLCLLVMLKRTVGKLCVDLLQVVGKNTYSSKWWFNVVLPDAKLKKAPETNPSMPTQHFQHTIEMENTFGQKETKTTQKKWGHYIFRVGELLKNDLYIYINTNGRKQ